MRGLEREFDGYRNKQIWFEVFDEITQLVPQKCEAEAVNDVLVALGGAFAVTVFKGDAYKFISTVTGQSAEEFAKTLVNENKVFQIRRIAEAFAYAYEKVNKVGADPNVVIPKILQPWMEGISLESDEYLHSKWRDLLVSAVLDKELHPSTPNILKQLTGAEARILDRIFKSLDSQIYDPFHDVLKTTFSCDSFQSMENLSTERFRGLIDNLERLNLCQSQANGRKERGKHFESGVDRISLIRQGLSEETVDILLDRIREAKYNHTGTYEEISLTYLGYPCVKAWSEIKD